MRVETVMTSPVISVEPSTSIDAAAKLMLANRISGLPVVRSDGTLAGIVSEGDFLRRGELGTERKRPRWLEFLTGPGKLAEEYVHAYSRKVEDVMTPDVVTIERGASLEDAVELMIRRRIKRIPVVESEGSDRIVGIVSRSDLMRALTRAMPAAAGAEPADDERIRQAVCAELDRQDWAGRGTIRVHVVDGVVELAGAIFDERQRLAARVAAENVPGVKSVKDELVWIEPISGTILMPPENEPAK